MQIRYITDNKSLVCKFTGNLTAETSANFASVIQEKIEDIKQQYMPGDELTIVFDMEEVNYLSSAFLRVCLIAAKQVSTGNFYMTQCTTFIKDLLVTAGFEHIARIDLQHQVHKVYQPAPEFSSRAHIPSLAAYRQLYDESIQDTEAFWARHAREHLRWFKPFTTTLEWNSPHARWFGGGQLNACDNCLDKHLESVIGDKIALIWEGEPESVDKPAAIRRLTYRQLHAEVVRFANVLQRNGIQKGDRVIIYMPMVPEAVIAMLACARIGAIHSVVFGGFSSQSIAERTADCGARMIITADGGYRRGTLVALKKNVDEALKLVDERGQVIAAALEKVIVLQRASNAVTMVEGRDVWWHEEMNRADRECAPQALESEDGLFILYTSGSTGKPKGIYHTTAGFLLDAKLSFQYVFDIQDTDIYWCTADIGWITGHSYVVYGPLANGATVFLYEGAPDYPEPDRFWKIIARHGITIFYTAPTAIRAFMKWGEQWPNRHDLTSLRLIGSVGEPINPEAWHWFNETIGNGRCPIVDTWWQTETGSIMISPLPGAIGTKPGSATVPFLGIQPEVVDENGKVLPPNELGSLVIRKPWPSMLRGIWGDPERYKEAYWSDVPGSYFTGDGARKDEDGYFWILGRLDDVINISGHRIGTAEVESALVGHLAVAESAAVSRPDDFKGSALVVFVTLKQGIGPHSGLAEELKKHVAASIGAVARPEEIRFTEALPKTRSGKIMRRLLKQIAAGTEVKGDMTTIEDFSVLQKLTAAE